MINICNIYLYWKVIIRAIILRMECKYRVTDLSYKNEKHDLVFFNFKDFRLVYNDTRRFGVFLVFSIKDDIYNLPPLSNVGDEPFDISKDEFYKKISSSNDKIKSLLLDQSITSGLGNIYADEVLFDASINPKRPGKSLSKEETDRLLESSKKILSLAIENGGTTIKSFESFNNESGHFQISLKVHTKEGKRCPNCGNIILKDRIGGRSSYYCPSCERIRDFKTYAITGTYSSGKSLVLSMIKEKGYKTYSLDDIYRELLESSTKMKREILKSFKTLDKSKLREIVYNDKHQKELLESITHKYILSELFNRIESDKEDIIFIEVPLLFETHFEKTFDYIIDVYSNREEENTKIKNVSKDIKEDVDKNQFDKEYKRLHSNYVLYNISNIIDLRKKVNELLKEILWVFSQPAQKQEKCIKKKH